MFNGTPLNHCVKICPPKRISRKNDLTKIEAFGSPLDAMGPLGSGDRRYINLFLGSILEVDQLADLVAFE